VDNDNSLFCKEHIDIRGLNKFISDKIRLVASEEVIDKNFENDSINRKYKNKIKIKQLKKMF